MSDAMPATSAVHTARNTVIMLASQVTTWTLTIAAMLVVPVYLGPERFGKLFFAHSLGMLLSIAVDLGLDTYLLKEVPRSPGEAGRMLSGTLLLKTVLFALMYMVGWWGVAALGYDSETITVVGVSLASMLTYGWIKSLTSVFQGHGRYADANVALIAEKVVYTVLAVIVLCSGIAGESAVVWVAWIFLFSTLVNVSWCLWRMRDLVRVHLCLDGVVLRRLLWGCLPFLVWAVFGQVYMFIDGTMLSLMAGHQVVGWYGMAVKLFGTLLFIPHILTSVLVPMLSRAYREQDGAFRATARRAFEVMAVVAAPMAAGLVLTSGRLVGLLDRAGDFLPSGPTLAVLALGLPPIYLAMALGSAIIAMDRQKEWSMASVGAAVLNVGLNLVLIPMTERAWGNGGLGAAAATVLTEYFVLGYFLWLLPAGFLGVSCGRMLRRTALATAVMAAVVLAARSLPLVLVVGAGVCAYGAAALALGTVHRADLALLPAALRRGGKDPRRPGEPQPAPAAQT